MPDLSNAELSIEGEHADCNTCGESFHWEQLTLTGDVYYCDDHVVRDYSDAIADLIGGLAEVWRMPDA